MLSRIVALAIVIGVGQMAYGQTWTFNPATGHWYRLTVVQGDWLEAQAEAASVGGYLVTVNDVDEDQWLSNTFFPAGGNQNRWIGLFQDPIDPNYSEPGGGWVWDNGESSTYRNWIPGEPNNGGGAEEWCEKPFDTIQWNDQAATASQPGIIERNSPSTGWVFNPVTGHWYRNTEVQDDWPDAEAEAVAVGGHLVTINDAAENAWVFANFGCDITANRWIGLIQNLDDPSCEPNCEPAGGWVWISGEPVVYTNWSPGEPNNSVPEGEDWGEMQCDDGTWNDHWAGSAPSPGVIERNSPPPGWADCNANDISDDCELVGNDCNTNGIPDDCESDFDTDGVIDDCDNCPSAPNGPDLGSCVQGGIGTCLADADCGTNGLCSMNQEDFNDDAEGDACDDDIDGDLVLNGDDACDYTPLGTAVDSEGRPLGDIDKDCDTDLDDYALFQQGFTGPGS